MRFLSCLILSWMCLLACGKAATANNALELKCQHSYIREWRQVILYLHIHNRTSHPVDILTLLPNTGIATFGASWFLTLYSNIYADNDPNRQFPIRSRLLPHTLKSHETFVFAHRLTVEKFDNAMPISVIYKISPWDGEHFHTWSGELRATSQFVPFYEPTTKKEQELRFP